MNLLPLLAVILVVGCVKEPKIEMESEPEMMDLYGEHRLIPSSTFTITDLGIRIQVTGTHTLKWWRSYTNGDTGKTEFHLWLEPKPIRINSDEVGVSTTDLKIEADFEGDRP